VSKGDCVDANARAQDLRREGRLALAREQLRLCADPACPALVRSDCVQLRGELDAVQPAVVFDAKSPSGADVFDVRVSIDGELVAKVLDGKPLRVDPGLHIFSFATQGSPTLFEKITVAEGETLRREHVVFGNQPDLVESPSSAGLGRQQVAGIAVGGAGVVGLGLGTLFGVLAASAWSNAKSACGGNPGQCTDVASGAAYHGTMETDGAISTASFIVGGALLAGGALLYFTANPRGHDVGRVASVSPSCGPGQLGLDLRGAF
jgi:serine/threonine-protein kinase